MTPREGQGSMARPGHRRRSRVGPWLAAWGWAMLLAPPAPACPVCRSETGRQVRAGIFDAAFASNATAVLLPFPVLLAIVAAIHRGSPPIRRRPGR